MEYGKGNISEKEEVSVNLMKAKGKERFYKKFGFEECSNVGMGLGMMLWMNLKE